MNFAIIGASGNVGRKTIEILEKSRIPFKELYLVASEKSAGKKIKFRGEEIVIENLESYDFSKAQITFFAAGSQIAKEWAPKAAKKTIVIDNSSYFRMQSDRLRSTRERRIRFSDPRVATRRRAAGCPGCTAACRASRPKCPRSHCPSRCSGS